MFLFDNFFCNYDFILALFMLCIIHFRQEFIHFQSELPDMFPDGELIYPWNFHYESIFKFPYNEYIFRLECIEVSTYAFHVLFLILCLSFNTFLLYIIVLQHINRASL